MILVFAGFVGLNIITTAQILSISFGILVLFLIYYLSKVMFDNSSEDQIVKTLFNLLSPFLLVYSGSLVYWSTGGMEMSFFVFF